LQSDTWVEIRDLIGRAKLDVQSDRV
jgi:hypothetical protein